MYFLDEVAVLPASGIYVYTCVYNIQFLFRSFKIAKILKYLSLCHL